MQTPKKHGASRGRLIRRVLLGLALAFAACATRFVQNRLVAEGNAVTVHSLKPAGVGDAVWSGDTFTLGTFNIAHGRGTNGSNFSSAAARHDRLEQIGRLLKGHQVDVAVLNEVDFDAVWTGGENQADIIARAGGFEHVMEQRNFDMALPFVRLRFGNAVLSKHTIQSAKLVTMPVHSRWENRLAGAKKGAFADIALREGLTVRLLAVHTDPRGEDLRLSCAGSVLECAKASPHPFICAGDFNSSRGSFPGVARSASGTTLMDALLGSTRFQTMPETAPAKELFTFASYDPRRVIDWILVPTNWQILRFEVLDVTLSDHRPVLMELRWKGGD